MNYNTVIDLEESKPLSIEEKENNLQQKKFQKALLTTPEKETEIQSLQQTFGLQKDVVKRNLIKLNKKDQIQNINNLKLHKTSPKLNNYLNKDQSNYNNLINDLSDLNYFERQWRYVKNQFEQGRQTVELANIGKRQLYGDFNDEDNKRKEIINKKFQELQNDYGITGLQQIPGKTAQMFPILAKTFVSGITGGLIGGGAGAAAGAGTALVAGQLGPQAATPEEIVTVPATAALFGSKGAKTGFRLGSAKAMFELEAGLAFNEYQDITLDTGEKIDVNTARGAAIITGVVNAGLEYLGFQSIAKNLPGFSSLKKESIKKALKNPIINNKIVNYARDIGTTAATEGSTEFFQELVTAGIGNLAKLQEENTPLSVDLILDSFFSEENIERGKQSFKDGAMGGAGIAITGKTVSSGIKYTSKEIQKRKQATETKQKLNELSEIVEKTNIKKVNKPVLKDALNEITDNQNVYIDTAVINTFYQEKGIDPREIIKREFGEKKANEFDEALENGQDIELPISEFMLSDDFQGENKEFFNRNAKLDPLDMTAQEWVEEESRLDAIDKEELEKEQSKTDEEKQKTIEEKEKAEESKTKVKQAVKEQLKEAGFNDKTSDTYSRLYESTFNSLGERLGVDPIELFNEFAPKIEKLDEEQTKGFLQTVGDKIKKVFQKKDQSEQQIDSDPKIMLQDDTPIIRGAFQFNDGTDFNIKLFKDANLSTFLHETGHYYLELMGALSEKENASQKIKDDFNNILKFLNVDKKSDIKTEQHEQFARAFEAYLMQGKAPSNALKDVFIRFKIWLTNLYLKMKNLNVELNDDINGVFDRIIATDNEIESVKGELNIDSMIQDTSVLGKKENAYKQAINDFNNAVVEKTTNKLMKQYQREKRKWYKEEMAQIKEEIEQELNQDKNYNLLKALQTGELELENQKIENFKFIKTELKNYFLKKHREQIKTIPEFEIDIMYKEISEGEAGKRYEGGYTPSTFPEYFQNKKLTKKQVLNIFDKYKNNERLTEKQQSILDILYTEFNNDPQVSYTKYLEKEHEKNIFSLIDNKLSPDDIEIMKQLEETEIVIDNISVGEILSAYEKIEKRESDSETQSVDSITGYEELYNSAQEYTQNELNKLPRAITNINGFALDIVAGMFDFESVDNMISTLQDITPRSEYIETRAQNTMKERYPNLESEETEFQEEIIQNIHNEKREEVLRFELKWLLEEAPGVFREGIRKISRRLPPKPQLKEYAQNFIAKQNINNIKPHLYLNAEKKAAREAGRLYAAGKLDLAFDQKKIELINHLKYIEAVKVKNDVEKTNILFRKFNQPDKKLTKTRDINLVNIGRSILSRYGIGDPVKFSDIFLKKTQEYDPVTYEILQPLIQDALIEQQDIKQISYNDFLNLKETIQTLWDLSRSNKEIELQDIKYDKDQLIEELSKDLPKRERAEGDSYITRGIARTENFLLNMKALATRIESWVDMMDKGNPDGIWRKVLFTPISEASELYRAKKTEKIKEFLEIVKSVEKEIDDTKIDAYEINHTFNNKGELIMALLHTGNKSNLAKLLLGYKWGSLDENNKLLTGKWDSFIERMIKEGVLTKTHFDFAQNVWDLLDSMKADAQRAHKKVYGNYFNEITAQEINTPFGTYKGGYFPAKVDPNKSIQQTFYDEAKIFDQNNNFMFPSTGSGFAKERVESFADKLELNVRVVPAHIDSVLKFTYIEPVVRNTAKLFYDKKFIKTLSDFDFDIVKNTIMPYLKRATSQRITTSDNTDANKIWSTLRKNVGMNFMFLNVANALMQFTGVFLSSAKVSSSHLLKGANQYLINTNRKKLREEISNKSVFMSNRIATSSIEISKQIEDIVLNPNLFQKAQSFSQKHAYFLQTATQDIVDTITWLGAYNEAIEGNKTEKQAVRIADSAVRQTQGTFNPEDLSAFETGSTFMRVILMFYNYFNMKSNLTYVETKKIVDELGAFKGSPQLALLFTKLYLLPVAVTMGIKMLSNGTLDEDEDGEIADDLSKRFFYTFTEETTGMFPIGGLIIQNAINQTDDEFYNDRLTASPVVSAVFENFSGIVKQASNTAKGKELNSRALIKKSSTLLGSITGLPLHAVGRSAGYVIDVKEGDAEPQNNLDYIRGVITGKRGN